MTRILLRDFLVDSGAQMLHRLLRDECGRLFLTRGTSGATFKSSQELIRLQCLSKWAPLENHLGAYGDHGGLRKNTDISSLPRALSTSTSVPATSPGTFGKSIRAGFEGPTVVADFPRPLNTDSGRASYKYTSISTYSATKAQREL